MELQAVNGLAWQASLRRRARARLELGDASGLEADLTVIARSTRRIDRDFVDRTRTELKRRLADS